MIFPLSVEILIGRKVAVLTSEAIPRVVFAAKRNTPLLRSEESLHVKLLTNIWVLRTPDRS